MNLGGESKRTHMNRLEKISESPLAAGNYMTEWGVLLMKVSELSTILWNSPTFVMSNMLFFLHHLTGLLVDSGKATCLDYFGDPLHLCQCIKLTSVLIPAGNRYFVFCVQ